MSESGGGATDEKGEMMPAGREIDLLTQSRSSRLGFTNVTCLYKAIMGLT